MSDLDLPTLVIELAAKQAAMEGRVDALEATAAKHVPAIDSHENRLDGHDAQLGSIRRALGLLQADMGRLADEATTTRVGVGVIDKNVARVLELLEASRG